MCKHSGLNSALSAVFRHLTGGSHSPLPLLIHGTPCLPLSGADGAGRHLGCESGAAPLCRAPYWPPSARRPFIALLRDLMRSPAWWSPREDTELLRMLTRARLVRGTPPATSAVAERADTRCVSWTRYRLHQQQGSIQQTV